MSADTPPATLAALLVVRIGWQGCSDPFSRRSGRILYIRVS